MCEGCAGEGAHRAIASDGDEDVRHLYFEIGGKVGGEASLRQLIEARGGLEASRASVRRWELRRDQKC